MPNYEDFSTIDWIRDKGDEQRLQFRAISLPNSFPLKAQTETLVNGIGQALFHAQSWILVSCIGLLAGLAASFLVVTTAFLSDLRQGHCRTHWYLNRRFCCLEVPLDACDDWAPWTQFTPFGIVVYVGWSLILACLSFFLVRYYAPYAASSGIPEIKTILGGFVINKFLGLRTALVKVLGVTLSVGSGLSLGRESTLVHISCCIGNVLSSYFSKYGANEARKREILSAASAAGFAVAFGSPMGGILFSLEELSSYFPLKTLWRSFFGCLVACMTLQLIDPYRNQKLVMYSTTYDRDWKWWETFFFMLLGVIGALFGHYFVRANLYLAQLRRSHPFWTGRQVSVRDWFFWVWPLMDRVRSWLRMDPLPHDYRTPRPGFLSATTSQHHLNESTSRYTRRWWNPSTTVAARYFQELVVVSLLTSLICYGNPFLKGEMNVFLAGLLRECPDDVLSRPVAVPPTTMTMRALLVNDTTPPPLPKIPFDQGSLEQADIFGLCFSPPSSTPDLPPTTDSDTFSYGSLMSLLLVTALIRSVLTTISFGLRIPAGILMPTMTIGACFGRVMGMLVRLLVQYLQQKQSSHILSSVTDQGDLDLAATSIKITPGTYALVGAASALGGVTRLTVTIVVVLFELTGGGALTYIVPIMISLMTCKFVSDALDARAKTRSSSTSSSSSESRVSNPSSSGTGKVITGSIFQAYVQFHAYPLLDHRREIHFFFPHLQTIFDPLDHSETHFISYRSVQARQVMTHASDLVIIPIFADEGGWIPADHTVSSLMRLVRETDVQGYPVVRSRESMVLEGFIQRRDLVGLLTRFIKKQSGSRNGEQVDVDGMRCFFFDQKWPVDFTQPFNYSAMKRRIGTGSVSPAIGTSSMAMNQKGSSSSPVLMIHEHPRAQQQQYSPSASSSAMMLDANAEDFQHPTIPFDYLYDLSHPSSSSSTSELEPYITFMPVLDLTPLRIGPAHPMDMVVELFKRLGLRFILVVRQGMEVLDDHDPSHTDTKEAPTGMGIGLGQPVPGSIMGLITKKDVLRAIEKLDMDEFGGPDSTSLNTGVDFGQGRPSVLRNRRRTSVSPVILSRRGSVLSDASSLNLNGIDGSEKSSKQQPQQNQTSSSTAAIMTTTRRDAWSTSRVQSPVGRDRVLSDTSINLSGDVNATVTPPNNLSTGAGVPDEEDAFVSASGTRFHFPPRRED